MSLVAFLLILASALIATAFSTTKKVSRMTTLSRSDPTFFSATKPGGVIISDTDKNATILSAAAADDANKKSSQNNKCAIIFLHGLGDSPDGWSTLAEALPKLRPALAKLDITYVFPPAQMVAITVNGGEKMPGAR